MTSQLETIDITVLDAICGGQQAAAQSNNGEFDWGMAHTVLTQGLSCAGGGALIGAMTGGGVPGAIIGGVGAGAACATTSYMAMRQQAQQSNRQQLPQATTPVTPPR
ncbi:MAG TPA: hypothetical protein VIV11_36785 [Kofleriaceae bacterium]